MNKSREDYISDALDIVHVGRFAADNPYNDIENHPYEFADGYADAMLGISEQSKGRTIAQDFAYQCGRREAKEKP